MDDHRRRDDDWIPIKIIKAAWPVLLAVISIVAMWTTLNYRVSTVEIIQGEKLPVLASHESRLVQLETKLNGMEKQLDSIDIKIDRIYQRVK